MYLLNDLQGLTACHSFTKQLFQGLDKFITYCLTLDSTLFTHTGICVEKELILVYDCVYNQVTLKYSLGSDNDSSYTATMYFSLCHSGQSLITLTRNY